VTTPLHIATQDSRDERLKVPELHHIHPSVSKRNEFWQGQPLSDSSQCLTSSLGHFLRAEDRCQQSHFHLASPCYGDPSSTLVAA
jgi:hypothetical protein